MSDRRGYQHTVKVLPTHPRHYQPIHHVNPKHMHAYLLNFLYNDIISIVLSYITSIEFTLLRTWGCLGCGDGEFHKLHGICLVDGEILAYEELNSSIQVFDQATGHFLRCWGGPKIFRFIVDIEYDGTDLFVLGHTLQNTSEIKVCSPLDGQLLRRFEYDKPRFSTLRLGREGQEGQECMYLSDTTCINVYSKLNGESSNKCQFLGRGQFEGCGKLFYQDQELFAVDYKAASVLVFNTRTNELVHKYRGYNRLDCSNQNKEGQEKEKEKEKGQGKETRKGKRKGKQKKRQDNQQNQNNQQNNQQEPQKEQQDKDAKIDFNDFDKIDTPHAIFVFGNQVIISEPSTTRIVVIDRDTGKKTQTFKTSDETPMIAKSFAVNNKNELFVADGYSERILVFK